MTKWHKGPPPSIGWWPASAVRNPHLYRWWDGRIWSCCAVDTDSAEHAALIARKEAGEKHIEWTDRPASWPARSRT